MLNPDVCCQSHLLTCLQVLLYLAFGMHPTVIHTLYPKCQGKGHAADLAKWHCGAKMLDCSVII